MAAALFRARLARDAKQNDWVVASAGIWAADGQPASEHAIAEMARRGISLTRHRSRPVTSALITAVDLVLVMTRNHAEALRNAFPANVQKIHLLTEMAGHVYDVQDPYGGTPEEYACTASELERLVEKGYERIIAMVKDE
jgi:protein-tyrosine phosphatase